MKKLPGNAWYVTPYTVVRRENTTIQIGQTSSLPLHYAPPKCCVCGYHGSKKLSDALSYGAFVSHYNIYIYRVHITGDIDKERDKFCGRDRTYLSALRVSSHTAELLYDLLDRSKVYPTLDEGALKKYSAKERKEIRANFEQFLSYFANSNFVLAPRRTKK